MKLPSFKNFFLSWATSFLKYVNFGDFSEILQKKKNGPKLGVSGGKRSCPTSKCFFFFSNFKTISTPPPPKKKNIISLPLLVPEICIAEVYVHKMAWPFSFFSKQIYILLRTTKHGKKKILKILILKQEQSNFTNVYVQKAFLLVHFLFLNPKILQNDPFLRLKPDKAYLDYSLHLKLNQNGHYLLYLCTLKKEKTK